MDQEVLAASEISSVLSKITKYKETEWLNTNFIAISLTAYIFF